MKKNRISQGLMRKASSLVSCLGLELFSLAFFAIWIKPIPMLFVRIEILDRQKLLVRLAPCRSGRTHFTRFGRLPFATSERCYGITQKMGKRDVVQIPEQVWVFEPVLFMFYTELVRRENRLTTTIAFVETKLLGHVEHDPFAKSI